MFLIRDDHTVNLAKENTESESSLFRNVNMFTWSESCTRYMNTTCFQLRSRSCASRCIPFFSMHIQVEGRAGFAAPLGFCQPCPPHWIHQPSASTTSRSVFRNQSRRLRQVEVGAFLLKRRRSRIIENRYESRVHLSMLGKAPLDASRSNSNAMNQGLLDVEAPKILEITDKWVAVDKPPGILVHRTKLYKNAPREKYLTDYVTELLEQEVGVVQKILPVHRLDRPTSGVMVFALGCAENAAELQAALKSHDCVKQYWALAFGAQMPKKWVNDHPLKDIDGKDKKQRNAKTEFEVIEVFGAADVVAVSARLSTGRRHQVRRHLSNSRHPILGDTSYCKGKLNRMVRDIYEVKRCCLHSQTLCFKDPSTAHQVSITAPLPSDLQNVLNHISRQTSSR